MTCYVFSSSFTEVVLALCTGLGVGNLGMWPGIFIGGGGLPFLGLIFLKLPSSPASNACLAAATREDKGTREITAPLVWSRWNVGEGDGEGEWRDE